MASNWRHQAPWFAFLIHLRSRRDLDSLSVSALLRRYSADDEEFYRRALSGPPVAISTVSFRSTPLLGEVIAIPRLPDDIMFSEGRRLIAQATEIAAQRGARVVGLGGLTASATRGGSSLLESVPRGVTLTNGNALTAAVTRHNVHEAREFLGLERPLVAVVGSTGSVGAAASELLAEDGLDLLLIGRTADKARLAARGLARNARFSGDLADVASADIVLVLTSGRSARVLPDHVDASRRRVMIDVAQPPNVDPALRTEFRSLGTLVVQGGWTQIPGVVSSADASAVMAGGDEDPPPGSAPACLAETALLAWEGIREHAVGDASSDLARQLSRVAARRGVRFRPLALPERTAAA